MSDRHWAKHSTEDELQSEVEALEAENEELVNQLADAWKERDRLQASVRHLQNVVNRATGIGLIMVVAVLPVAVNLWL